jgi:ABC-2 type transport system permease protein
MSPAQTVRLVAGREISTRIRSRALLWTTGLLVLAIVGGGVILDLAIGSPTATTVAVTPQTEALAQPMQDIARAGNETVDVARVPDDVAAEAAVRSEEVDAALTGTASDFTVVVRSDPDPAQYSMLTVLRQQAALRSVVTDLGGDPDAVAQQLASATLTIRALEPAPERDGGQIAAGYVAGILLFLALQTTAQLVSQGVVEEKSTRVVELLLSTIRPWQLMTGKVLGIGVIGLIQVVAVIGAAVGTALTLGLLDTSSLDLGSTVVWALAWFVLGFVTYALALASLASLVSRQEDVASVTAPVLILMIIPYVVGISIAPWDPTNTIVVVLSYIPFAAPLVMPMRIALGTVETWQVLASFALSAALVPALVWAAGRIYSNAVLRTGARVRLRDALRMG